MYVFSLPPIAEFFSVIKSLDDHAPTISSYWKIREKILAGN